MPFPSSESELESQGYRFIASSECRGCREPIEWWETPNGKKIPLNLDCKPHWETCPKRDDFRRKDNG